MKKIELLLIIISLVGLTMVGLFIPVGSKIFYYGLMALSIFYLIFSFLLFNKIEIINLFKKTTYRNISLKRSFSTIGLGFSLFILLRVLLIAFSGISDARMFLLFALAFSLLILIVALIKYKKNKSSFYPRVFKRLLPLMGLALLLYILPRTYIAEFRYGNNKELMYLINKHINNPDDPRANLELIEYWENNPHY